MVSVKIILLLVRKVTCWTNETKSFALKLIVQLPVENCQGHSPSLRPIHRRSQSHEIYAVSFHGYLITAPLSEGMGKVLFSQVSVCLHFVGGAWLWGTYPSWGGGTYLGQGSYPPPIQGRNPLLSRAGTSPPHPPPHSPETDQHTEYLLHGKRYASCVHARGLSCLWPIFYSF